MFSARHPQGALLLLFSTLLLLGCGTGPERLPPGRPPSPETISKRHPGGDAHDPHLAALLKQKKSDWGHRTDRDHQARFPLLDRRHWTRIRFGYVDHLTAFKYGDENHAVTAAFIIPLKEGDPRTSKQCVARFEEMAIPYISRYGGEVTEVESFAGKWREEKLFTRRATGSLDVLFKHYDVAMAWTGYPAYPDTCLIYTLVIQWNGHRKLAESVRNRWTKGFERFVPLTESKPYRH